MVKPAIRRIQNMIFTLLNSHSLHTHTYQVYTTYNNMMTDDVRPKKKKKKRKRVAEYHVSINDNNFDVFRKKNHVY